MLLIWLGQKLEAQKSIVDENKKLLQGKLNEQEAKAKSIQGILSGNEVHVKLEELKQKLSNLQQSGIKLQEGKILNNCFSTTELFSLEFWFDAIGEIIPLHNFCYLESTLVSFTPCYISDSASYFSIQKWTLKNGRPTTNQFLKISDSWLVSWTQKSEHKTHVENNPRSVTSAANFKQQCNEVEITTKRFLFQGFGG